MTLSYTHNIFIGGEKALELVGVYGYAGVWIGTVVHAQVFLAKNSKNILGLRDKMHLATCIFRVQNTWKPGNRAMMASQENFVDIKLLGKIV